MLIRYLVVAAVISAVLWADALPADDGGEERISSSTMVAEELPAVPASENFSLAAEDPTVAPPVPLPVATFFFDEGDGKVAEEMDGKFSARLEGTQWAFGHRNKGLLFNGRDSFVSLGNVDPLDGNFTVSAWVKPRVLVEEGYQTILAKQRACSISNQFRLYITNHNRVGFAMSDSGYRGRVKMETTADMLPVHEWSHLAVRRFGPNFMLFINGEKVLEQDVADTIRHENHVDMRLGACYSIATDKPTRVFRGLIDSVRLEDVAARPADIVALVALDRQGAYRKAGGWDRASIRPRWTEMVVDLTPYCPEPGEYELLFLQFRGQNPVDLSGVLLMGAREDVNVRVPLKTAGMPRRFLLNVEAVQPSLYLSAGIRALGGSDSQGEILIREMP